MNSTPKSEEEWRERLSDEEYRVIREGGTEQAFSGKYVDNHESGVYHCKACGTELFSSDTKFDSGSGWPSFTSPKVAGNVGVRLDNSHGMRRTEVYCKNCNGHLGHVFDDGPVDTGSKRYCINSVCLNFEEK